MAFDISDIEDENFRNVSADVKAIFEPFINCDCETHGKSHIPEFNGRSSTSLKRGHDEDSENWETFGFEMDQEKTDPDDSEDCLDLEKALAKARAQLLAQEQAKNKSSYKKPSRDENFESFVSKADTRVESILKLRPENYVCSGCHERADVFCKACVQYFCKSCHQKCNGNNHFIKTFCPELNATDRLLRFKNTFQQYRQCVSITSKDTLCSCEGECKKAASISFRRKDSHVTILHSDFTLTTGDITWCTAYSDDPFVALWAYGYLQMSTLNLNKHNTNWNHVEFAFEQPTISRPLDVRRRGAAKKVVRKRCPLLGR